MTASSLHDLAIPPAAGPWRNYLPAAGAFLLAFALYACTIGGDWVLDDVLFLGADPRVTDISRWHEFFTQGYAVWAHDNLWRPLTSLSFALQHQISGATLWPLHLFNVVAHALASALVAEFARRLIGPRAAWIAGLLFAAHPVHVDATAYLVGRAESLCAIGVLAVLVLCLARPLTIPRAWGIFACFLFAALCKEQGILVPLLLAALAALQHWHRFRTDPPPTPQERHARKWLLALMLCGLSAYLIYRQSILPFLWDRELLEWTFNPIIRSRGWDRLLVPIAILGRYTQLLIAPWQLSLDYGAKVIEPVQSLRDPYLYLGILAAIAWLAGTAYALARRKTAAAFCLIAFALVYGLISNFLFLIGTAFGERLMYLPSAFFVVLVACAAQRLPRRWLLTAGLLVLALFSLRTLTYAARWDNRLEFTRISAREQPRSIMLQFLLIDAELAQSPPNLDAAEAAAAHLRQIAPEHGSAWERSALVAEARGDTQTAAAYWARAAELVMHDIKTWLTPAPPSR
jgi:hypothetical protein